MKRISKTTTLLLAAATTFLVAGTFSVAEAGRGGSDGKIRSAINTGSTTAIIAEVERAERLVCGACIDTVMGLLDDDRYEVREVAAWWFARRPAQKAELTDRSIARLYADDATQARNAADILGTFRHPVAIAALSDAAVRTDMPAEVRAHAVRALGRIGHPDANPAIAAALNDSDASVRLEAVDAWHKILRQPDAGPVANIVNDGDLLVRRRAAAVVGTFRDPAARTALEERLANDDDPVVRRNAAWSLGRIGDPASRAVLEEATDDESPLVRRYAEQALRSLR